MSENNNGYTKIVDRKDLPNKEIGCWFIIDGKKYLGVFSHLSNCFYHKTARYHYVEVSHYIEVLEPENEPLY